MRVEEIDNARKGEHDTRESSRGRMVDFIHHHANDLGRPVHLCEANNVKVKRRRGGGDDGKKETRV